MVNRFCSFTWKPPAIRAAAALPVNVPGAPEVGSRRPNRSVDVTPVPTKLVTAFRKKPIDA